jgi:HTH-type transcriptional regulator, sugar sensing transcriptional regulator
MFKKVLLQADLTPSQAEILEFLYQHKEAKASEIAKSIKRSRAIVYKEAEELAKLGIIEIKERPGKVTVYTAGHPSTLEKLIENKENQIKKDRELLTNYLPDMISSYNLINNKPGIRYYEGVDGLKKIYNEILEDGKDFFMVRSAYEPVYKTEMMPIIKDFISKRVEKNINVKAITPIDQISDTTKDKDWLMERIPVPKEMYNAPVEIDVFGNKIAFLSFGHELIGIVIESDQIAQSLKQLLLLIQSNPNHAPDSNSFHTQLR